MVDSVFFDGLICIFTLYKNIKHNWHKNKENT